MSFVTRLELRRLLSTYYINPLGDDAADGLSPDTAWRSISRVNSTDLEPGDAVLFRGGDSFAGSLLLDAADSGKPAAPVTLGSYGTGRATIAPGNSNGLCGVNVQGVAVQSLNFVGSGQAAASFNGIAFDNSLAGDVKLPFVQIDDADVSGFGNYGITVGGSRGKSGFADVRITNVNVHDNLAGGIETHGVFAATSTAYANANVYVGHATVHHNPGYAGSSNHVGDGIVLSDADGVTIERCVAFENGARNTHVGGPVGIWVWDANNATIQHNESHHNHTASTADGGGFDFDGGVTNSVMQYNYSHDNDGAGYGIFQFQGARPLHDLTVRYNISENDGRKNTYAGVQFWNGNGSNGIRNVEVYGNTVFTGPASGASPAGIYFQNGTTNVHVRNNIFQTTGGLMIANVQAKQTGLLFQGNDYWSSGGAFKVKYFAKTYSSLAAFRSGSGQEMLNGAAVGLSVNPLLSAPGAGGSVGNADLLETALAAYRLQSASPLRDAALNPWSNFNTDPGPADFFGTALPPTREQGVLRRYDVGAHEYA